MKSRFKLPLPIILGSLVILAAGSAAYAASDNTDREAVSSVHGASSDHPECFSDRKDDPADFCYQVIGPWNSIKMSTNQVRELIPLDAMVRAGRPTSEIQEYYPEYQLSK